MMKMKRKMSCVCMIAVVLMVLLTGCGNRVETLDMSEYITVTFDGINGNGRTIVDVHYYDIEEMVFGPAEDAEDELAYLNDVIRLESTLGYKVVDGTGLQNGDLVTVEFSVNEEAAEELGFRLKQTSLTFEVNGLRDAEELDPFADVEVKFSGIAPEGYVLEVKNTSQNEFLQHVSYTYDASKNLSNGDTVTIQANYYDYMAEEYGYVVTRDSATYTVEGLTAYVTALDQIDSAALEKIDRQTTDMIKSFLVTVDGTEAYLYLTSQYIFGSLEFTYGDITIEDFTLLSLKEGFSYLDKNILVVMCSVPVTVSSEKDGELLNGNAYIAVRFYNLMVEEDGTTAVDISKAGCDYDLEQNRELLYDQLVTSNIGKYTVETMEK